MSQTKEKNIIRINLGRKHAHKDLIIREIPFSILVNEQQLVTLLCSPQKLEYLTVGFLLSEDLVRDKSEIKGMNLHQDKEGYYINAKLNGNFKVPPNFFQKRLISSGCGKGTSFFDSQQGVDLQPVDSKVQMSQDEIFRLMDELEKRSSLFKVTGGAHSAAICKQTCQPRPTGAPPAPDEGGQAGRQAEIQVFAEDIGRHNAVDKVFGECMMKNISTNDKIVLTSGRISVEILTKVARRKVPIILSRSAPMDLAVRLAEKLNMTLVGFVRGKRMNIYTCDWRVV